MNIKLKTKAIKVKRTLMLITLLASTQFFFAQNFEFLKGYKGFIAYLTCIDVDNNGNVWIGADKGGLTLYDKANYYQYYPQNSNIGFLIRDVYAASDGKVWLSYAVEEGIACFKGKKYTAYTNKEIKNLIKYISVITEDQSGNLYFGGWGLLKFDGKYWKQIPIPEEIKKINDLAVNKKGMIAVAYNDGLIIYVDETWKKFTSDNSELRPGHVRALKYSNSEELYIGYSAYGGGGFSIMSDDKWVHYNKSNTALPDYSVNDIEISNKGDVWFATDKGLITYTGRAIKHVPVLNDNYNCKIIDIAFEGDTLWIISNRGLIKMTE